MAALASFRLRPGVSEVQFFRDGKVPMLHDADGVHSGNGEGYEVRSRDEAESILHKEAMDELEGWPRMFQFCEVCLVTRSGATADEREEALYQVGRGGLCPTCWQERAASGSCSCG